MHFLKEFSTIVTLISFSACAIIEEAEDTSTQINHFTVEDYAETKSVIQEDSTQVAMRCQSNKKLILIHQIIQRDGIYYLNLTDQDISQLSIPDSLYNWAQNCVLRLNKE